MVREAAIGHRALGLATTTTATRGIEDRWRAPAKQPGTPGSERSVVVVWSIPLDGRDREKPQGAWAEADRAFYVSETAEAYIRAEALGDEPADEPPDAEADASALEGTEAAGSADADRSAAKNPDTEADEPPEAGTRTPALPQAARAARASGPSASTPPVTTSFMRAVTLWIVEESGPISPHHLRRDRREARVAEIDVPDPRERLLEGEQRA